MLVDFLKSERDHFQVDICIIGAGAAGLTLATQFLGGPWRVLVVESGGPTPREEDQDLNSAEVLGLPHEGVHYGRVRAVGGTTTRWGGQALPFLEADFAPRPWVRDSGWPISREMLAPYYARACSVLGLDERIPFGARPWRAAGVREPAFAPHSLEFVLSKWSPHPDLGRRYLRSIRRSPNLTLVHGATVTALNAAPPGCAITSATVRSANGKRAIVHSRLFILAGGAIETCRLLLASNDVHRGGIGNGADLVGRYFQDHAACIVGLLAPTNQQRFEDLFDPFYIHGQKHLPRLVLDPARAAAETLLHASLQVLNSAAAQGQLGDLKALAKRVGAGRLDLEAARLGARAAKSPPAITAALWRRLVRRRGVSTRKGTLWLEVHSEQEPLADSRVMLSEACDSFGMPRVRLDWRVSELTGTTIRRAATLVRDEFRRLGLGEVVLDDWVEDLTHDWRPYIGDVYHQCGGARMATTAKVGVVNTDCQVFGVNNLYLASSAVFPTSSFSNPTLTMMALALRLADHVKTELRGR